MRLWFSFLRQAQAACGAVAAWTALAGTALAQGFQSLPPSGPKPAGSYVVSYMLVLLGIGLAMVVLCRSSRRRERARPEQYEEGKIALDEK